MNSSVVLASATIWQGTRANLRIQEAVHSMYSQSTVHTVRWGQPKNVLTCFYFAMCPSDFRLCSSTKWRDATWLQKSGMESVSFISSMARKQTLDDHVLTLQSMSSSKYALKLWASQKCKSGERERDINLGRSSRNWRKCFHVPDDLNFSAEVGYHQALGKEPISCEWG